METSNPPNGLGSRGTQTTGIPWENGFFGSFNAVLPHASLGYRALAAEFAGAGASRASPARVRDDDEPTIDLDHSVGAGQYALELSQLSGLNAYAAIRYVTCRLPGTANTNPGRNSSVWDLDIIAHGKYAISTNYRWFCTPPTDDLTCLIIDQEPGKEYKWFAVCRIRVRIDDRVDLKFVTGLDGQGRHTADTLPFGNNVPIPTACTLDASNVSCLNLGISLKVERDAGEIDGRNFWRARRQPL